MTTHKKRALAATIAAICVAGTGTAIASSHARTVREGAQEARILGLPSGYAAINTQTCKFATTEVDVRPSTSEAYARAEDLRHDALDNCLRRRLNQPTTKPTFSYVPVLAVGTGASVTASCPAGYYVVGGGSQHEVQGSYPADDGQWTVTRDPKSPAQLDVRAVCIRVTP